MDCWGLKGKVAIVTGAGAGLGKSHAIVLATAGTKVVVTDFTKEKVEKVAAEIEGSGGEAIAVRCDVRKKSEVEAMVNAAISKWGKIDILVNNAGINEVRLLTDLTEEDWDKTLDINLKGSFLCAQACVKEMAKQNKGVIINTSSIAMGQIGFGQAWCVHYSASKGGIVAMSQALAVELAPMNIRVNAIAPGMFQTQMNAGIEQFPEAKEQMINKIPMGRFGKPEEVSNLVLFLASDMSSYMTGSTVIIDGGMIA